MKQRINWKTVIVTAIISIIGAYLIVPKASTSSATGKEKESVYDRVIRTGKIRCGYNVWAPALVKDTETGELSGLFYEYMEEIGKRVNLKIEWTEEVSFGNISESLKNERFDVFCTTVWLNSIRGRHMEFIDPLYFDTLEAFVRKGDNRFTNNKDAINNENITIATIDGETSDITAKDRFPKAKRSSHANLTTPDIPLMDVVTGKADVSLTDLVNGYAFTEKNPGKLEVVKFKTPIRMASNQMALKKGEIALKTMLDNATKDLLYDGTVEKLIKKYEEYPKTLKRVKLPIEE